MLSRFSYSGYNINKIHGRWRVPFFGRGSEHNNFGEELWPGDRSNRSDHSRERVAHENAQLNPKLLQYCQHIQHEPFQRRVAEIKHELTR